MNESPGQALLGHFPCFDPLPSPTKLQSILGIKLISGQLHV